MIKKLLPVVFLIVGLGAGVGAGIALKPADKPVAEDAEAKPDQKKSEKDDKKSKDSKSDKDKKKSDKDKKAAEFEYLKLTKQFVVPVVTDDEISALVTMSLSLEAIPGLSEQFYEIEPKLRDGFLQVMFDHANIGGFNGAFTQSKNLSVLRKALLEVAQKQMGADISDVLIMSIARQDT